MIKQTVDEWLEEGNNKFGKIKDWKFICPACGHISRVQEYLDLGAKENDAYQNCIGRFNKKGEDGMGGKDKGFGCNWAAYGLLGNLGQGRVVITKENKEIQVFDFAK